MFYLKIEYLILNMYIFWYYFYEFFFLFRKCIQTDNSFLIGFLSQSWIWSIIPCLVHARIICRTQFQAQRGHFWSRGAFFGAFVLWSPFNEIDHSPNIGPIPTSEEGPSPWVFKTLDKSWIISKAEAQHRKKVHKKLSLEQPSSNQIKVGLHEHKAHLSMAHQF